MFVIDDKGNLNSQLIQSLFNNKSDKSKDPERGAAGSKQSHHKSDKSKDPERGAAGSKQSHHKSDKSKDPERGAAGSKQSHHKSDKSFLSKDKTLPGIQLDYLVALSVFTTIKSEQEIINIS